MSLKLERVKKEVDWAGGVSEAAVQEGLYEGHVVKNETVFGPEEYQPQDMYFSLKASCINTKTDIKQEHIQDDHSDSQLPLNSRRHSIDKKELDMKSSIFKIEPGTDQDNNYINLDVQKDSINYTSEVKKEPIMKPKIYKKITEIYPRKKVFYCDYCSKEFTMKASLLCHIRIHTGEKPHQCMVCEKRFTDSATLTRHKRVHTGEKPYSCMVCKKKFSDKYLLTNHRRIHTGEKPFSCDICQKQYKDCSVLSKHKKNHELRPFACEICHKLFASKSQLVSHSSTHNKTKPHNCEICDKSFASVSHLNRHLDVHAGGKKFMCGVCDIQFSQFSALKRHMQRQICKERSS